MQTTYWFHILRRFRFSLPLGGVTLFIQISIIIYLSKYLSISIYLSIYIIIHVCALSMSLLLIYLILHIGSKVSLNKFKIDPIKFYRINWSDLSGGVDRILLKTSRSLSVEYLVSGSSEMRHWDQELYMYRNALRLWYAKSVLLLLGGIITNLGINNIYRGRIIAMISPECSTQTWRIS